MFAHYGYKHILFKFPQPKTLANKACSFVCISIGSLTSLREMYEARDKFVFVMLISTRSFRSVQTVLYKAKPNQAAGPTEFAHSS